MGKYLPNHIVNIAKKIDEKHEKIAARIEGVSMVTGVLTGIASAGAALAAPTWLTAIGVALGINSAPLVVTAAPVLATIATVSGAVAGGAYYYSKWRNHQKKKDISQ